MKFYIPTSSLNLDNILQAESISPSSYYSKRISGYKTFEVIEELRSCSNIILFKSPIKFETDDPNRYNFPLLIEIEDDAQLNENSLCRVSDGVFSFSNTIYLTPSNCRIFFFSERDYKITAVNTKSNKAIKYYGEYKIFRSVPYKKLQELQTIQYSDSLSGGDETDEIVFDKRKGLLYAYLLGDAMSITPELAKQKRLTQEIYDIVVGIIANFSMAENFKPKLEKLLNEYKQIDKTEKNCRIIFDNQLDADMGRCKFLKSSLISLLKKWGVWEVIFRELSKRWNCQWLPSANNLKTPEHYKYALHELERRTQFGIDEYKKTKPPTLITGILFKDRIEFKNKQILSVALNYIIDNRVTPEQLSAHKPEVCLGMVNAIKNDFLLTHEELDWNNGPRDYVNRLYSHIQNVGVPFNLNDTNIEELRGVAAFILRGQNIENYLTYLKMNDTFDYVSPLLLWGAMVGYMEMNRDLLAPVLSMDNYATTYKMLTGMPMYQADVEKTSGVDIAAEDIATKDDLNELGESKLTELESWKRTIVDYALKEAIKQNIERLKQSLYKALEDNRDNTDYSVFLNALLEYDGWRTGKGKPSEPWKRMYQHFVTDCHKEKDTPVQPSLFEQHAELRSRLFVEDEGVREFISTRTYLTDGICNVLSEKVVSFQKDYAPGGYYYKRSDSPKTNDNTINHFINKCTYQKQDGRPSWIDGTPENKRMLEKLKNDLYERYANI